MYRVLHRLAVLTDLKFIFMALDPILFPDIPSGIEAHSGFVIEHMKTANQILVEVKRLMDAYSSTSVVLVSLTTDIREITFKIYFIYKIYISKLNLFLFNKFNLN